MGNFTGDPGVEIGPLVWGRVGWCVDLHCEGHTVEISSLGTAEVG